MSIFAETVEQFEVRWEAFLAENTVDDAAILDAMPPADALTGEALPLDFELPY